jgi:hypothetical protein
MEINYYSNYPATKYLNARPDIAVPGATFSFLNALPLTRKLMPVDFFRSYLRQHCATVSQVHLLWSPEGCIP